MSDRLLRIKQIIPDMLPIGKSAFWDGVAKGKYPQPIRLGTRTTCWRESDILAIVKNGKLTKPAPHKPAHSDVV
jgi:predicted DNA-binding transcriptional regulator AlpA